MLCCILIQFAIEFFCLVFFLPGSYLWLFDSYWSSCKIGFRIWQLWKYLWTEECKSRGNTEQWFRPHRKEVSTLSNSCCFSSWGNIVSFHLAENKNDSIEKIKEFRSTCYCVISDVLSLLNDSFYGFVWESVRPACISLNHVLWSLKLDSHGCFCVIEVDCFRNIQSTSSGLLVLLAKWCHFWLFSRIQLECIYKTHLY